MLSYDPVTPTTKLCNNWVKSSELLNGVVWLQDLVKKSILLYTWSGWWE